MTCKIVKPYDWQSVRDRRLSILVEGIAGPGYSASIFSYDGYFGVAQAGRTALRQVGILVKSTCLGYAVIEVGEAWGPCVISVADPAGSEVAASGVKFGHTETTTWLSDMSPASDIKYPLGLISSAISHTHSNLHRPLVMTPDVSALCDMPAGELVGTVGCAVVSQAKGYDGLHSLSKEYSVGQDDPVFGAMISDSAWTSSVPYIARFQDVIIQSPSGLVMFEDGLWSDSTLTAFFNDPELRQHSVLFRAQGEVGYLGNPRETRDILADNSLDQFPGIPMLLSNVGYRNHAHWIMNSMLAAYYCRSEIISGKICVLVPEYSDYIFASLMALGIKRESIVVVHQGFYRLDHVLFPSTLSTHVNRCPPPELAEMFETIRRHCVGRVKATPRRLIYLTRKGSGAQRKISNEDELIAALKLRGFACIAPHELSFEEEVACVSGADVIVGQLGAALMNIAFAPRKAWVVELTSHNYASSDYWTLATLLGQRFVRVLTRAPSDDTLTLTDFSFELPLEATLGAIDSVCTAVLGERGVIA